MSFVLKIVEGPNRGAEAALVEGVAVTIGKSDECDIVLADSSLPNVPVKIETTAEGVSIDGELLEPLHVRTLGDTSFAVGPANGPWGKLVWPAPEKPAEPAPAKEAEAPAPQQSENVEAEEKTDDEKKKSHGCLVWFIALLILAFACAGAGYYYRDWLMPRVEPYRPQAEAAYGWTRDHAKVAYHWCSKKCVDLYGKISDRIREKPEVVEPARDPAEVIAEIVEVHGLEIVETDGRISISGNLKTRAERLGVTAEIYGVLPCVELSLSDDETLKTAVEDTLSLIGETGLRVRGVTNRVAVLDGRASDITMVTMRLTDEVPRLTAIDATSVALPEVASVAPEATDESAGEATAAPVSQPVARPQTTMPELPVCGILTMPYPCLVTRSGARIMEGASIGEWTVVKIGADYVVLQGKAGRFVWRP